MADARALAYQRRLAGLFAQSACVQTIVRAGASHDVLCFYQPMDQGTIGVYFDGNESVGLLHPALMLWTQNAADVQVGDVFYHDDQNRPGTLIFTVRKVQFFRQGLTPLLMLALCD